MPDDAQRLAALKVMDFRRTVLLEDWRNESSAPSSAGSFREVRVQSYRPNEVRLKLPDGGSGWLVLTDVWYPGWVCKIDGNEVPLHRANYLFRAVQVKSGADEVVFRFEPRSYRIGTIVSGLTLVVVVVMFARSIPRRTVEA